MHCVLRASCDVHVFPFLVMARAHGAGAYLNAPFSSFIVTKLILPAGGPVTQFWKSLLFFGNSQFGIMAHFLSSRKVSRCHLFCIAQFLYS